MIDAFGQKIYIYAQININIIISFSHLFDELLISIVEPKVCLSFYLEPIIFQEYL